MNVAITGNTYPVKDQLREMGARWDPAGKRWLIDASQAEAARLIVEGGPNGPFSTATASRERPKRNIACHDCGAPSKGYYRCYHCSLDHREGGDMYAGGRSYRDSNGAFVLGADD